MLPTKPTSQGSIGRLIKGSLDSLFGKGIIELVRQELSCCRGGLSVSYLGRFRMNMVSPQSTGSEGALR